MAPEEWEKPRLCSQECASEDARWHLKLDHAQGKNQVLCSLNAVTGEE